MVFVEVKYYQSLNVFLLQEYHLIMFIYVTFKPYIQYKWHSTQPVKRKKVGGGQNEWSKKEFFYVLEYKKFPLKGRYFMFWLNLWTYFYLSAITWVRNLTY